MFCCQSDMDKYGGALLGRVIWGIQAFWCDVGGPVLSAHLDLFWWFMAIRMFLVLQVGMF